MKKNLSRIAAVVSVILLIPVFGNLYVEGWNWGPFDFVIMGTLLFCTGLMIDFAMRKVTKPTYRVLSVLGVIGVFILIWGAMVANLGEKLLEKLVCGGVC